MKGLKELEKLPRSKVERYIIDTNNIQIIYSYADFLFSFFYSRIEKLERKISRLNNVFFEFDLSLLPDSKKNNLVKELSSEKARTLYESSFIYKEFIEAHCAKLLGNILINDDKFNEKITLSLLNCPNIIVNIPLLGIIKQLLCDALFQIKRIRVELNVLHLSNIAREIDDTFFQIVFCNEFIYDIHYEGDEVVLADLITLIKKGMNIHVVKEMNHCIVSNGILDLTKENLAELKIGKKELPSLEFYTYVQQSVRTIPVAFKIEVERINDFTVSGINSYGTEVILTNHESREVFPVRYSFRTFNFLSFFPRRNIIRSMMFSKIYSKFIYGSSTLFAMSNANGSITQNCVSLLSLEYQQSYLMHSIHFFNTINLALIDTNALADEIADIDLKCIYKQRSNGILGLYSTNYMPISINLFFNLIKKCTMHMER